MKTNRKIRHSALVLALCLLAACSKSNSVAPTVPSLAQGPEVTSSNVPKGTTQLLPGPSSSTINVANLGKDSDKFYVEVEAALSPAAYAKAKAAGANGLKTAIDGSIASLKKVGVIEIDQSPEVGYYTFWLPYQRDLFAALKTVSLPAETYVNPLSYDLNSLKQIKEFTAANEGFTPRSDSTSFSGLSLIHAPEFVALAESSMPGVKVDGSSVRIGITDTGITYRHPTFTDAAGKNRIQYMKDFTRESRMYFNPTAKFEATLTDEATNEFKITADYLETQTLPKLPDPTVFKTVTDQKVVVSDELKAILKDTTKFKVLMSMLRESTLQGGEGVVDLNGNGTLTDEIPAFLVIDTTTNDVRVFANFSADYDFSGAVGLHNFNSAHETTKVFAESIGFHIQKDALIAAGATAPTAVLSASMMGYDAGNHGTHVAGIAAGRKTIANDRDDTLARGVAPNAQILMDRVCANNGGCDATRAIIDIAQNGKAEVVNMSLGGLSPFNDGYGVQETVVNRISNIYNVQFMISAGNSGPGRQTVGSPSTAKQALSIGAAASRSLIQRQYQWAGTGSANPTSAQDDEFMLFFSSRGPTAAGGFKPNISAPGTELSSVQLNSAPGGRAGMDVYWGTSMAAPTATGAYALLLDAIKKFNIVNPDNMMASDASTLSAVLVQTARPFSTSEFTWMDEGTGMIDLVAAWKELLALRTEKMSSGVTDATGKNVNLEYDVMTVIKNPTGQVYNGSRTAATDAQGGTVPAFGTGLYLKASDAGSFYPVYIGRHLTEKSLASPEAGDLTVQLVTTAEEFVLKTDFGKDAPWLKAGVTEQLDCLNAQTANLRVLSRGSTVSPATDTDPATINPFEASDLNVCIDRAKLASLGAGDHGALIYAYRTDGTTTATIPSFIVPVSVTNPEQTLGSSTAYDLNAKVKSFGVTKHYVVIPKGAQLVKITLETAEKKPADACSGVELMDMEGGNTTGPKDRAAMQARNCDSTGAANTDPAKRTLVLNRTNPLPGVWEFDIFGAYRFSESSYHLRVDYLMADMSVKEISGDQSALNGMLTWTLKESSLAIAPDATTSTYTLNGLFHKEASKVAQDAQVLVGGPLGEFRSYPADVKKVTITTGGSPGNDIDLDVLECDTVAGAGCVIAGQSGTATDEETVTFTPKAGKFYAARVTGYDIKDAGNFFSAEIQVYAAEPGTLVITDIGNGVSQVDYSFTHDQLATSKILASPLYTSKDYQAVGLLTLRTADKVTICAASVLIK
jgi:hypothetical protein